MCNVLKPILLNLFKHHLYFIKSRIHHINSYNDYHQLQKDITSIGSSIMDVYIGKIGPAILSSMILKMIGEENYTNKKTYKTWLANTGKEYRIIELSDNSNWVCRYSKEKPGYYIHIHPARHSPNTIRIKANTYKTAILFKAKKQIENIRDVTDELILSVRCHDLKLSPVKSLSQLKQLQALINLLI